MTKRAKGDGLISTLRDTIIFIAIFLYFNGWIYIYYFYNHFGVSVNQLNIEFYAFFAYSYTVLHSNLYWFVLMFAIVVGVAYLLKYLLSRLQGRSDAVSGAERKVQIWGIVIATVILFPLCFYLARETALSEAIRMRRGNAKKVVLTLKANPPEAYPADFRKANEEMRLRLLTATKENTIVFVQPGAEEPELPYGFTYVIPNGEIYSAKIFMQNAK